MVDVRSECFLGKVDLVDLADLAEMEDLVMDQALEIHSQLGRMVVQTRDHIRQRLPCHVST